MRQKAGWLLTLVMSAWIVAACTTNLSRGSSVEIEPGMSMDEGMMQRHMASVPIEYVNLTNPVTADANSLARGETIYEANCVVCHGEMGLGNGPAAATLDPPPAPIAHTAQMHSDAYLFYRISEGGNLTPFNSAMPAFKQMLSGNERWDVINYVRSLNNRMTNGGMMNCMMGSGMMGGMMILSLLLLIGLIVAVVLVASGVVRRAGKPAQPAESPRETLKRRYAQGEISSEQFEAMKRQLDES